MLRKCRPTHPLNLKFSIFNSQFAIQPPAPPRRALALTRIFVFLLLAAVSLAAALLFLFAARVGAGPRVSITPTAYETWTGPPFASKESYLYVRVAITNTGHIALSYNMVNFCDDAWLRTESSSGWTDRDIHPAMAIPAAGFVLKPGARTIRLIRLPKDTLRWQVGYTIRAASLRQRVFSTLPPRWILRLYSLYRRLPNREGPKQRAQSPVFECSQNEPVAMEGRPPMAFDSEAPPWIVPESEPHP